MPDPKNRSREGIFPPGLCALCGRDPAAGFATINGKRYCHGDYDPYPTCYMRGQQRMVVAYDR